MTHPIELAACYPPQAHQTSTSLPVLSAAPSRQPSPSLFTVDFSSTAQLQGTQIPDPQAAAQIPAIRAPRMIFIGAKRPLALAAAAATGKLVMAIGASAIVRAARTDGLTDTIVSCAMLVSGFVGAVTAAVMFGQDVAHVASSKRAWALKAVSISAAITLAGASALSQYIQDDDLKSYGWLPFAMGTLGYGLLCVSLPSFFACSEEHNGPSVMRHRQRVMRCLGAGGFSVGLSWASYVSTMETLPRYIAPSVLTIASTSVLLSFALASSNSPRVRALCEPPSVAS